MSWVFFSMSSPKSSNTSFTFFSNLRTENKNRHTWWNNQYSKTNLNKLCLHVLHYHNQYFYISGNKMVEMEAKTNNCLLFFNMRSHFGRSHPQAVPSVLVSCCRRVLAVMTSILWILQNSTTSLHSNWKDHREFIQSVLKHIWEWVGVKQSSLSTSESTKCRW